MVRFHCDVSTELLFFTRKTNKRFIASRPLVEGQFSIRGSGLLAPAGTGAAQTSPNLSHHVECCFSMKYYS